jgi:hypothetical protein
MWRFWLVFVVTLRFSNGLPKKSGIVNVRKDFRDAAASKSLISSNPRLFRLARKDGEKTFSVTS